MSTTIAILVFVVVYTLIATEKVARVPAAMVGAGLLFTAGVMKSHDAFFSERTGVDWNVIFLLFGMMIIVGIIGRTGIFDYMGTRVMQLAHGRPRRIMTLLVIITAAASALLDNVTTILLLAPVTLSICKKLHLQPVPFLLAEVFASNIGGASTLIGDPPNIIIAGRSGLSFNDFLVHMMPIVILVMVVFVVALPMVFRDLGNTPKSFNASALDARAEIRDPRLLTKSAVVLGLVLLGFVTHSVTHTEPSIVALVGAGVLMLLSRLSIEECIEDVEWETLAFFLALFIMVGSLVKVGVMEDLANYATDHVGNRMLLASMTLLGVSAALSGIVDNIPYVAAMSPLVQSVVADSGNTGGSHALWWALALGADFGGNATAVGASANVVMIGIAKKAGHPISFWQFTRTGALVTLGSVALCVPYVWLRYFTLA